jgi:hypothetical protein
MPGLCPPHAARIFDQLMKVNIHILFIYRIYTHIDPHHAPGSMNAQTRSCATALTLYPYGLQRLDSITAHRAEIGLFLSNPRACGRFIVVCSSSDWRSRYGACGIMGLQRNHGFTVISTILVELFCRISVRLNPQISLLLYTYLSFA